MSSPGKVSRKAGWLVQCSVQAWPSSSPRRAREKAASAAAPTPGAASRVGGSQNRFLARDEMVGIAAGTHDDAIDGWRVAGREIRFDADAVGRMDPVLAGTDGD